MCCTNFDTVCVIIQDSDVASEGEDERGGEVAEISVSVTNTCALFSNDTLIDLLRSLHGRELRWSRRKLTKLRYI